MEKKLSDLEENDKSTGQDQETILYEIDEWYKRANNIMVFNVPESSSALLNERIDHDKKQVVDLFAKLDMHQDNDRILKVIRVGKSGDAANKSRPIKIVCNGSDVVMKALKNSSKLRSNGQQSSSITISKDLTKQQQDLNKKVRQECKDRKAKGENVYIKYKNGVPFVTHVNTKKKTMFDPIKCILYEFRGFSHKE